MAPKPRTDVTDTELRGFVRRDEAFPEDCAEYRAGCGIENRKRPPPPEVPGDAFDRQRVIPGFDQALIERQSCLVLGAGGIGQDVALVLGRLGVAKIVLVDRDVYDASNLTRQCLGGKSDVGERKVDVAAKSLRQQHSLRSEVVAVHMDAVKEWGRIVSLAKEATVVFNGIDAGLVFDYAVNSLCKELAIPLVCGQSFGWKFMVELYTGRDGECCAFCHDSALGAFQASESAVTKSFGALQRLLAFLGEDKEDVGAAALAAFLKSDEQFRCGSCDELVEAALKGKKLRRASLAEDLLSFLRAFHDEVTSKLLPGEVSKVVDASFIPKPKAVATRYIGSWVCPCLGGAVMMVSQWTAHLTSPLAGGTLKRELPQTVTMNLDAGMTGEEQLGYELGPLGAVMDKYERRFSTEKSSECCRVCAAAAALRAEESLFVGRLPVTLAPVAGEIVHPPREWRLPHDKATAEKVALARRAPLRDNVVLPALPALDWERGEGSSAALPAALAHVPLMKVPSGREDAGAPSAMLGIASGSRSALVKVGQRWWRLKGCGNEDEGFPLKAVGDQGELSIRGCCFRHTADTELRITALATEALAAHGLEAANCAAGSWIYKEGSVLPEIERHCAVFETLGNARLGDHLIAGLLQLLPVVVADEGALREVIAKGRCADAEDLWPTAMVVSCGMATADAAVVSLEESAPPASNAAVPCELTNVWEKARTKLAALLKPAKEASNEGSLLLWLAYRLGWECGATLRALHSAGIAWGTYPDAMGIHCNAHSNNLVIKPPSNSNTFLAALDFDMAFTREAFLPEAVASHASVGLESFEGVLSFEAEMGMKQVLGGSDFGNTGVRNEVEVPESHKVVEMALWDTLVAGYEAARNGGRDAHPMQEAMREAAYELIKLALCLTTHVQG